MTLLPPRIWRLTVLLGAVAIATRILAPGASIAGEDNRALQKVRDAWKKRQADIKSFEYECKLVTSTVVPVRGADADDPFAEPKIDGATTVRLRNGTMRFSVAANKISLEHGATDIPPDGSDDLPKESRSQAVFDGRESRSIRIGGTHLVLGTLQRDGKPLDILTVYTHETAYYLAYSPADFLDRVGCDVGNITVRATDVDVDGRKCFELTMPRKRPSKWIARLYVDPARDYVPVALKHELDGALYNHVAIEYTKDQAAGWRVTGWTNEQFNAKGKLKETTWGKVTRCTVNEPLDDALFRLEFPVGTHIDEITERGETKGYFKQGKKGELIPIEKAEYGREDAAGPDAK